MIWTERALEIKIPSLHHQADSTSDWVLDHGNILTHQRGLELEMISLHTLIEAAQIKAGTSITSQVEEVHSISIANGLSER